MNTYETISQTLSEKFVRFQEIARILAVGFESGQNVLLWGPGGHGKSEMVEAAFRSISDEEDIFVQSFGEGMDEGRLWGGPNLKVLEEEGYLAFFPERSFLAKPLAIFEEIFDAPAVVLLALKDTLQRRQLRNGSQNFKMKTQFCVALTNKDPKEVAELGPSAQALIERFPLQMKVEWPTYEVQDYLELLAKIDQFVDGPRLNGMAGLIAELVVKANEQTGYAISPRTVVHALRFAKTAARMRGSEKVEQQDLLDLRFLPGMEPLADKMDQELTAAHRLAVASALLKDGWRVYHGIEHLAHREESPLALLKLAALCEKLEDEITTMIHPPSDLQSDKSSLLDEVRQLFRDLGGETRGYKNTRVDLPEEVLGIGYQPSVPQSGHLTVAELKEALLYEEENYHIEDDDEDFDPTRTSRFGKGTSSRSGGSNSRFSSSRFKKNN